MPRAVFGRARAGLVIAALVAVVLAPGARAAQETTDQKVERLRKVLEAPDSPGVEGFNAKFKALQEVNWLRADARPLKDLVIEQLRGPRGEDLAKFPIASILVHLGPAQRKEIEELLAAGKLPPKAAAVVLKKFDETDKARADWDTGAGADRVKGLYILDRYELITRDDALKALNDTEPRAQLVGIRWSRSPQMEEAKLARVVELLKSPNREVQTEALRALFDQKTLDPKPVEEAVFSLRYEHDAQQLVGSWFSRYPITRPELVDQLLKDLESDKNPVNRRFAIGMLRTPAADLPKVLPALAMLSEKDPDQSIRRAAMDQWSALKQIKSASPAMADPAAKQAAMYPLLVQTLRDKRISGSARNHSFLELDEYMRADAQVGGDLADVVVEAMGADDNVWAAHCLSTGLRGSLAQFPEAAWKGLHRTEPKFAEHIREKLRWDDNAWKVWMIGVASATGDECLDCIKQINEGHGGPGKEVVPAFIQCIQTNADPRVRAEAIRTMDLRLSTLVANSRHESAAVAAMIKAATDSAPAVRLQAVQALGGGYFWHKHPGVTDAVLAAVGDADPQVQAKALTGLARLIQERRISVTPANKALDANLKRALSDARPEVQGAARTVWAATHGNQLPPTAGPTPSAALVRGAGPGPVAWLMLILVGALALAVPLGLVIWGLTRLNVAGGGAAVPEERRQSALDHAARGALVAAVFFGIAPVAVLVLSVGLGALFTRTGGIAMLAGVVVALWALAVGVWAHLARYGRTFDIVFTAVLVCLVGLVSAAALLVDVLTLVSPQAGSHRWEDVSRIATELAAVAGAIYAIANLARAGLRPAVPMATVAAPRPPKIV